jgi:hypothetical protein
MSSQDSGVEHFNHDIIHHCAVVVYLVAESDPYAFQVRSGSSGAVHPATGIRIRHSYKTSSGSVVWFSDCNLRFPHPVDILDELYRPERLCLRHGFWLHVVRQGFAFRFRNRPVVVEPPEMAVVEMHPHYFLPPFFFVDALRFDFGVVKDLAALVLLPKNPTSRPMLKVSANAERRGR